MDSLLADTIGFEAAGGVVHGSPGGSSTWITLLYIAGGILAGAALWALLNYLFNRRIESIKAVHSQLPFMKDPKYKGYLAVQRAVVRLEEGLLNLRLCITKLPVGKHHDESHWKQDMEKLAAARQAVLAAGATVHDQFQSHRALFVELEQAMTGMEGYMDSLKQILDDHWRVVDCPSPGPVTAGSDGFPESDRQVGQSAVDAIAVAEGLCQDIRVLLQNDTLGPMTGRKLPFRTPESPQSMVLRLDGLRRCGDREADIG